MGTASTTNQFFIVKPSEPKKTAGKHTKNYGKIHHVQWVNPRTKSPFSSSQTVKNYQRETYVFWGPCGGNSMGLVYYNDGEIWMFYVLNPHCFDGNIFHFCWLNLIFWMVKSVKSQFFGWLIPMSTQEEEEKGAMEVAPMEPPKPWDVLRWRDLVLSPEDLPQL